MLSSCQNSDKIIIAQDMCFGLVGRPSRYDTCCDLARRGARKIIERRGKKLRCIYLLSEINDESMNISLVIGLNANEVPTLDVDIETEVYKVQRDL